jgi:glutathione S-transferase
MTAVLWHIEVSHYNEKARWALDYKGIAYALKVPMPGLHGVRALRRYMWHYTLQDIDTVVDSLFTRPAPARERMLRMTAPVVRPLVRRDYGVDAATVGEARAKVVAAMDRLEAELQPSGYLVGDTFGVADLTAAALFTPLLAPPARRTCRGASRLRPGSCATS